MNTPTSPRRVNPLHLIHKWSIEHPHVVLAFYLAVVLLAGIAITPHFAAPFRALRAKSAARRRHDDARPVGARYGNPTFPSRLKSRWSMCRACGTCAPTRRTAFPSSTLEFPYGTDVAKATTDVQSLLNVVQGNLPATGANLKPSFVVPIDPLNLPILTLSLRGDAQQGWDMVRVREFADNAAINAIKAVPGVYSIVPFGGYRRQMPGIGGSRQTGGLQTFDSRRARCAGSFQRQPSRRSSHAGRAGKHRARRCAGAKAVRHSQLPDQDRRKYSRSPLPDLARLGHPSPKFGRGGRGRGRRA